MAWGQYGSTGGAGSGCSGGSDDGGLLSEQC